jgi:hypothetical protein
MVAKDLLETDSIWCRHYGIYDLKQPYHYFNFAVWENFFAKKIVGDHDLQILLLCNISCIQIWIEIEAYHI